MLWGSKKQLTCSCQITIKEIKAFCTPLHFCYISDWFYYHFLPRNESLRYGNFTVDLFQVKKICLYILNAYYHQLCSFCTLIFIWFAFFFAYSYQVCTNCMLIFIRFALFVRLFILGVLFCEDRYLAPVSRNHA